MSWSDIFPVMDDEMVKAFLDAGETEQIEQIKSWFEIESIHNFQVAKHLVSASLFFKPAFHDEVDIPELSEDLLRHPEKHKVHFRIGGSPWDHYVRPLLRGARKVQKKCRGVVFRVYLARDMAFLIPRLVRAGCEVFLMKTSSIRHNPGAMWRFLALEEDVKVTMTDADRAPKVVHDIERTELMARGGLGHWRMAYTWGKVEAEQACPGYYRTILACQFGSSKALPIRTLAEAFVWHSLNGTLRETCLFFGKEERIFGTKWPSYGFDEWFLNAAVYPRIAFGGVLTFVSQDDSNRFCNQWFALDIEYCTWANPKSEIVFYGKAVPQTPSMRGLGSKEDGG